MNMRIMSLATLAWTAWAVASALALDDRALSITLALLSAVVPVAMLLVALRLQSRLAADRIAYWSLPAAMLMVFVVDLVAWAIEH